MSEEETYRTRGTGGGREGGGGTEIGKDSTSSWPQVVNCYNSSGGSGSGGDLVEGGGWGGAGEGGGKIRKEEGAGGYEKENKAEGKGERPSSLRSCIRYLEIARREMFSCTSIMLTFVRWMSNHIL